MHVMGTGLVGRTHANDRLAADQGGFAVGQHALCLGSDQRGFNSSRVVAIDGRNHVPTIGVETLGCVIGEPAFHVAVNRDAVVIVKRNQFGQAQRAGQRAGLVADAFHQATVAQENIGEVVHDGVAGLVEFSGQQFLSQRHADRVGNALPERAGGGFHTWGHAHFRVTCGLAVQLAKVLQLAHRQVIAGKVQQRVNEHRTVAIGEHKTVAVGPVRVGRIVAEVAVPQHFGNVGHAHRRARVARFGFFNGVNRQHANGIGHLFGKFGGRVTHVNPQNNY